MMRRRSIFPEWLLALVALSACADGVEPVPNSSNALAPHGFDVPLTATGTLPSYQTDAEKADAKADRFDVRGNYRDIYGVTAPPVGARAVAQFEPTDGVLISWDNGVADFLIELVDALDEAAAITLITWDASESAQLRAYFRQIGVRTERMKFFEFEHEAFWTRDYGPWTIALPDGRPAFVDNAYYPERRRDDAIPTLLGRALNVPVYRTPIATEGGNFATNGDGVCFATYWLREENPDLSAADLAQVKADYLGCEQTIILERLEGEGTGHVDMYAKFVSRDTVLVGRYTTAQDRTNAAILDRNAQRLSQVRLADGTPLKVVRIPMPTPRYPVYRSYTNALIANDTVVVPVYPSDRRYEAQALQVWREALPGHTLVTVDSDGVIELGGAVHCTTMSYNTNRVRPANGPVAPVLPPSPNTQAELVSTPGLRIRDNSEISDVLTSDAAGTLGSVEVSLDIDHAYVGDLIVYLVHDDAYVVLSDRAGGNASGLRTTYTVDGFRGRPKAGDWTLVVRDTATQDEGRLNGWSVAF